LDEHEMNSPYGSGRFDGANVKAGRAARRLWIQPTGIVVLGIVASLFLRGNSEPSFPQIYAHRGDTSHAPENTVESISAALAWADGIEVDLWLARDDTFRLHHDRLPPHYRDLPTLEEAVAAAGTLPLDLDLKDHRLEAHERLGQWIVESGIAGRTTVNVKSIDGARAIARIAPDVIVEAQPDWVPTATTAPEIELVLVWGDDWHTVLEVRPPSEVALFVNSIHEPGTSRWLEAREAGIARYFSSTPPRPAASGHYRGRVSFTGPRVSQAPGSS
jgi:hypothetical protein